MHSNINKEILGLELQFSDLINSLKSSFEHHLEVSKVNGGYIQKGAVENMQEMIARISCLLSPQ